MLDNGCFSSSNPHRCTSMTSAINSRPLQLGSGRREGLVTDNQHTVQHCSMLHTLRPVHRLRPHFILRRSPHRARASTSPKSSPPKPSKDAQDSQRLSLSRPSLGYLIVEISRTDWRATINTLRREMRSMPGQQGALRRVVWILALPVGVAMTIGMLATSWTQDEDEE
ncbi:uncharacterized protein J3D65DRAFT_177962 [Phyllosticta citribraziliensis]|uniref:Uncharacterized protein n=1 Tax=Phyllosticta citribraziliensis TaxID=989973 RepID=A0ABR1L209_9PEZI